MKLVTAGLMLLLSTIFAQIQKPVSGRIDFYEDFKSKFVTARNIEVWLPEGYNKSKKYAVLYMHDGQMLYDASTTWNKQSWDVDDIATRMIKDGEVQDFIVVGVWNGGETRGIDYFPQKPFETGIAGLEKSGKIPKEEIEKIKISFKPISDNYLRFLVTEVKPFIDSVYSVYKDKQHTFVAGSSMGGLISMYAVTQYPEIFGGAACISTHWPGGPASPDNPMPRVFSDYLKDHLKYLDNNKIYFDCGDKTLDSLYPPLQKMIDEVMKSYPSNLWKSEFFPGKDHSENAWKERFHIPLKFLLGINNKTSKLDSKLPYYINNYQENLLSKR